MLKQKRAKELDTFYDFAYKCDDDYDIMAKVVKMHVKEKYCIIKAHLELTNITNYLNAMRKASSNDIDTARLEVMNERRSLLDGVQ